MHPALYFNLLHIDDDPSYLALVARAIATHHPRWTVDSECADREWIRQWPDRIGDRLTDYDCVVFDFQLVDCTADTLLRQITERFDTIPPMVVLSATLTAERREICYDAGALAALDKPFNAFDLARVLDLCEHLAIAPIRPPDYILAQGHGRSQRTPPDRPR